MSVIEDIRNKYDSLTKKQKDIAGYMLDNPDSMCFTTLKQLSCEVGVSEMTVLNLCTALGYKNFNEVKYAFRVYAAAVRKEAVSRDDTYVLPYIPKEELKDKSGLFGQMCQDELNNINAFVSGVRTDDYFKAARMICRSERVLMCGRGVSVQIANYMMTRLTMCGVASIVIDTELGDAVQSSLYFMDGRTLVMPISFPDYYFMTTQLAKYAKSKGAVLVGMTDSEKSEIASLCDVTLLCPTNSRLFLNSATTPMIAASLLTAAVSVEKNESAGDKESLSLEFSRLFGGV